MHVLQACSENSHSYSIELPIVNCPLSASYNWVSGSAV